MELIQKTYEENGEYYYFHSIGKWFLLFKYVGFSLNTELRYDFSEKELLEDKAFKTTITKTVLKDEDIGKFHYAEFENDFNHVILLGVANMTIIAHSNSRKVTIKEKPFNNYYNYYIKHYEKVAVFFATISLI